MGGSKYIYTVRCSHFLQNGIVLDGCIFFITGKARELSSRVLHCWREESCYALKLRVIVTHYFNIPCEQDVIANIVYCKSYSRRNAFFKNRSKEEDDL